MSQNYLPPFIIQ